MIVDDIFVANLEGDSKFILKVKDNPKIFGIIEKKYSPSRTKDLYSIKYYWNGVFQDKTYADDMDKAKEKLKRILKQVVDQTTNMKYIQTYESYNNGEQYLFHYTMIERAIKIIEDGKLKQREYDIYNKYAKDYAEHEYGYISFTEDPDFHDNTMDIPVEVRFVFDRKKLEKDYELKPFSFDEEKMNYFKNEYDEYDFENDGFELMIANEEWFGDEGEFRIYNYDIPIKKYIVAVEIVEGGLPEEEKMLKDICDKNNIEFFDEIS